MYYAITVDSNEVITGVHESMHPITAETFAASQIFAGQEVIPVPNGNIKADVLVASYTDDWTLKPLSQRVAEGLVEIPEGHVLDGEEIRPMTPQERIDTGLDNPPEESPPVDETQTRIMQLKAELALSDYRIIKAYEYALIGLPAPYNIDEMHAERQAMRDEINELENQCNQ